MEESKVYHKWQERRVQDVFKITAQMPSAFFYKIIHVFKVISSYIVRGTGLFNFYHLFHDKPRKALRYSE